MSRRPPEGPDLERALLRSALLDAPPHGPERLLEALAAATPAAIATAVERAGGLASVRAAHAGSLPSASPPASLPSWSPGLLGAKVAGLVAVVAGAGVAWSVSLSGVPLRAEEPLLSVPSESENSPAVGGHLVSTLGTALGAAEPARGRSEPAAAVGDAPPAVRAERNDLSLEVLALDLVRRLLRDGNVDGAGAALDRYFDDFPNGVLGPEALALEIESVAKRGDAGRARELAVEFLLRFPDVPQAPRVRMHLQP